MVTDGIIKLQKSKDRDVCEGFTYGRMVGSFIPGAVLVAVLFIGAIVLAIMPGSASLVAEPVSSVAVDQPSGCPCSGGCGTAPVLQDSQAEIAEINAMGQDAQPANSPVNTVQQPVVSAPAADAGPVAAAEPASIAPENANANPIGDVAGSFSSASFKMALPSWWLNREQGSDTLNNILDKGRDVHPLDASPGFNGWQTRPINTIQAPMQPAKLNNQIAQDNTKTLTIKWQRLLSNNETCSRCGSTEEEVEKAVSALRQNLEPKGIKVVLEKVELTDAEFQKDPLQSNKIWINNRPLEDWVGGKTGQSKCSGVCGPCDCRTTEVGGEVYEAIPADLIIKAGLQAASQL